jgi:lipopolysaccharide/colanic/teichoic acid biosynthesis glycosyltransferase
VAVVRGRSRVGADSGTTITRAASLERRLRLLDILVAGTAFVLLLPVFALAALAIRLESRGPVLYRCRRVGFGGEEFAMLKFRKMREGASGAPLTAVDDERFTRMGSLLAKTKLDELPQLLNVLMGSMSIVGPRPEDPLFVAMRAAEYARILRARPGITGLSQLAFACEMEILDPADRVGDYLRRLMPQKMCLDELYVTHRSVRMYVSILWWTVLAVVLRRAVAVNRGTGRMSVRRRPRPLPAETLVEGSVS